MSKKPNIVKSFIEQCYIINVHLLYYTKITNTYKRKNDVDLTHSWEDNGYIL